ncbi:conserved exported hypothetical protein [uncultured Desulfatiglans sp.]|uniref:Uncharacterized protein n=1 Tax=Uncultured Desulfatiglans sp. TaxID=1748965 RepID=A0A653A5L6_UNCDX|nr:conserved exported hypothetical protein [uncultured Desulfatiglans sp.]
MIGIVNTIVFALMLFFCAFTAGPSSAADVSTAQLMEELEAMKRRVQQLEEQLQRTVAADEAQKDSGRRASVEEEGLPERIRKIEQQLKEKTLPSTLAKRVTLSGLIEAEAGYEKIRYSDPARADEDSSDIILSTVELGVDVDIAKHVSGHVLFLWEEDDTEPVDMDEGFITLDGEDIVPLYLTAGKMYVPFGNYETFFISDPLTLEIGETRESGVRAGFYNDLLDASAALFNGDVGKIGDDDHIDSFVGSIAFSLPEELITDLGLTAGAAYLSNIADSDGLEGETSGEIQDEIAGLGAFLSLAYRDRAFLQCEYVGALDHFEAGELSFDEGRAAKPRAWNIEFAVVPAADITLAVKYEGSRDLGVFQPEEQYGAAITYDLFANTAISLEYLRGEHENGDQRDLLTTQLAIEF